MNKIIILILITIFIPLSIASVDTLKPAQLQQPYEI